MKTIKQNIGSLIVGIAFVCGIIPILQAQIIIQTPVVRADDYRTVLLRWSAETGAVYQVESADALEAEGPQGLRWVIREADCISKGTNAEWLDVGDVRWIPRVLHPVFQDQRNYRVQKVVQATNASATVTIQLSQTNSISSNFTASISVSVTDTNFSLSSVGVFVDGQRLYSLPLTNFAVAINSTEWPNGPHEVYAVANYSDRAETTPADDWDEAATNASQVAVGVSQSKFVTFSNYISQFFVAVPYFEAGQTQEVVAKFEEDSYWRVKVVNYLDTEVRRFEGQGTSCYAAWDGNDQSGSPLPYGYYDYIIEARPSQFGPLSLTGGSGSGSSMMLASASGNQNEASAISQSALYKRTAPAMQFSRTLSDIHEGVKIPSLKPASNDKSLTETTEKGDTLFPSTAREALEAGLTSYFVKSPPMPPVVVKVNGKLKFVPWEEIHGEHPPTEIQISQATQDKFLAEILGMSIEGGENQPEQASWNDEVYMTRTPTRIPGNLFFGFAGTVGIGYQGHHPKKPPTFGTAPGGVLAKPPPWGKIFSASKLANAFSLSMGLAGWRTSFLLGDDSFNSTNLAPVLGPYSGTGKFASSCNFGLFVGHMSASVNNDPNYFATVPYLPVYNSAQPGAYQWLELPGMDLGNQNGTSKLRWMAFYGCQSLKNRDYSDLWSKFLLPMPPNLRMILGSEDGIFVDPRFGDYFSDELNGWTTPNNTPAPIFDAWCNAAGYVDALEDSKWWRHLPLTPRVGTRQMTAVYRDTTQGGSWNTLNDSIWWWGTDVSFDWFDVSFITRIVYQ